ncbi:MAG: hypothetical protein HRU20_05750 [Pseudomonadales bacterium]|nr:hypothetical protein [Pseudomonadales bacterium]
MLVNKQLCLAAALSMTMLSTQTQSSEVDLSFSGFASFAVTKTTSKEEEGDYNDEITNESNFRDLNLLGLRLDGDLDDSLSFGAQMVAYGKDDYEPDFDWIYVSYAFTPGLSLTAGKIRAPLYMYSDFIDVGYAYQWIDTPDAIYGRTFFKSLDGGKLSYISSIGDWTSEVLVFAGTTQEDFTVTLEDDTGASFDEASHVEVDDAMGIAWTMEYEWLTFRIVYAQMDVTLDDFSAIEKSVAGLNAIAQGMPGIDISELEQHFYLQEDTTEHYGAGLTLDFDYFFAVTEYTKSDIEDNMVSSGKEAYYVMMGTRLPAGWSISLTYSSLKTDVNQDTLDLSNELTADYINDPDRRVSGSAAAMRSTVEGILHVAQESLVQEYIIGARWDFHRSAAMKFEYMLKDDDGYAYDSSTFTLSEINLQPSAYRIGLDMIF